jgi:hypothetical protein
MHISASFEKIEKINCYYVTLRILYIDIGFKISKLSFLTVQSDNGKTISVESTVCAI